LTGSVGLAFRGWFQAARLGCIVGLGGVSPNAAVAVRAFCPSDVAFASLVPRVGMRGAASVALLSSNQPRTTQAAIAGLLLSGRFGDIRL